MKKLTTILVVLLVFTGCKSSINMDKDIQFYSTKEGPTHHLSLFKNGRFKYEVYEGGLGNPYSQGNWVLSKGKIRLLSDEIFKQGIISVLETRTDSNKIDITVFEPNYGVIPGYTVIINNQYEYVANFDGLVSFPILEKIKTIRINYMNENYSYKVKNNLVNNFRISFRAKERFKIYFDNEFWEIVHNKLINPSGETFKHRQRKSGMRYL